MLLARNKKLIWHIVSLKKLKSFINARFCSIKLCQYYSEYLIFFTVAYFKNVCKYRMKLYQHDCCLNTFWQFTTCQEPYSLCAAWCVCTVCLVSGGLIGCLVEALFLCLFILVLQCCVTVPTVNTCTATENSSIS